MHSLAVILYLFVYTIRTFRTPKLWKNPSLNPWSEPLYINKVIRDFSVSHKEKFKRQIIDGCCLRWDGSGSTFSSIVWRIIWSNILEVHSICQSETSIHFSRRHHFCVEWLWGLRVLWGATSTVFLPRDMCHGGASWVTTKMERTSSGSIDTKYLDFTVWTRNRGSLRPLYSKYEIRSYWVL